MAKKILTKKDFKALLKKSTIGLSVEYDGYKIGYQRKADVIHMINLDNDDLICIIDVSYRHTNENDYKEVENVLISMFNVYKSELDNEEDTINYCESVSSVEDKPKSLVETITDEISKNIAISGVAQLNVALLIRTVYEKKLYEELDFKNIYEYCSTKFGIARGTTSNWLMVANNFGEYDPTSERYILDKRLQGFSITQLILLRSIGIDEILMYFDEDMSCREIKDKVNSLFKHITVGAKEVQSPVENEEDTEPTEAEIKPEVNERRASSNIIIELVGGSKFINTEGWKVLVEKLTSSEGKKFELRLTLKD